jgi:ribosomal protein L16 Arg81 hydroxylase
MAPASGSLAESRWSGGGSSGSDASQGASNSQTSLESQANTSECSPNKRQADIKRIAAYFAEKSAPEEVQEAFRRVCDASRRVNETTTEQAIRQLQTVVQKLSTQVEKNNS